MSLVFIYFLKSNANQSALLSWPLANLFFTFMHKERLHMKTLLRRLFLPVIALSLMVGALLAVGPATAKTPSAYVPPANNRIKFNFDYDWKFIKQDVAGAETVAFKESTPPEGHLPPSYNAIAPR